MRNWVSNWNSLVHGRLDLEVQENTIQHGWFNFAKAITETIVGINCTYHRVMQPKLHQITKKSDLKQFLWGGVKL